MFVAATTQLATDVVIVDGPYRVQGIAEADTIRPCERATTAYFVVTLALTNIMRLWQSRTRDPRGHRNTVISAIS